MSKLSDAIGRGALDGSDAFAGMLRFAAMGLISTLAYFAGVMALHAGGLSARAASAIAMVLCWAISYAIQSRVTFRQKSTSLGDAARFVLMSAGGLAISEIVMTFVYGWMGWPLWAAAAVVCAAIPIFNFLIMNFWVFRKAPSIASTR